MPRNVDYCMRSLLIGWIRRWLCLWRWKRCFEYLTFRPKYIFLNVGTKGMGPVHLSVRRHGLPIALQPRKIRRELKTRTIGVRYQHISDGSVPWLLIYLERSLISRYKPWVTDVVTFPQSMTKGGGKADGHSSCLTAHAVDYEYQVVT